MASSTNLPINHCSRSLALIRGFFSNPGSPDMKRLILAILAGFFITAILSILTDHVFHITEVFPPYGQPMFDTGLLLLALAYRGVFTLFGCYIMAMIAKEKAMKAAIIVGSIRNEKEKGKRQALMKSPLLRSAY